MKTVLKSGMLKILLILDIVFFVLFILGKAAASLAVTVSNFTVFKIPVGKPFGALISAIAKPLTVLGGFFKILVVINVILLILMVVLNVFRKKRQNKAVDAVAGIEEGESKESKKEKISKMMDAFK